MLPSASGAPRVFPTRVLDLGHKSFLHSPTHPPIRPPPSLPPSLHPSLRHLAWPVWPDARRHQAPGERRCMRTIQAARPSNRQWPRHHWLRRVMCSATPTIRALIASHRIHARCSTSLGRRNPFRACCCPAGQAWLGRSACAAVHTRYLVHDNAALNLAYPAASLAIPET